MQLCPIQQTFYICYGLQKRKHESLINIRTAIVKEIMEENTSKKA